MTTASQLPAEAAAWLRDIQRRITPLPDDVQSELLAGLAEHLAESHESGVPMSEALSRLGNSSAIAEQAFQQHQQQTGLDMRPRYFNAKRVVQYATATLALAAVIAVTLLPSYIEVTTNSSKEEVITSAPQHPRKKRPPRRAVCLLTTQQL